MEADFKLIADSSADCELWLALDGGPNWINSTVEAYTGHSAQSCLAWPDFPDPLIAEQDRGAWQFMLAEARAGHEARDLNLRLRHRQGYLMPASVSARLVHGPDRHPAGLRLNLRLIEDPKRLELAMRRVVQLVARTTGQGFYDAMGQALDEVVGADLFLIGRLLQPTAEVRTLALLIDGQRQANLTYPLADTPCNVVMGQEVCIYRDGVAELFPKDAMLRELGMAGYIGYALYDCEGRPIGILVALYRAAILEPDWAKTLLGLFAPRIGAEIERDDAERELRALNEQLEGRVQARTGELQHALDHLRATQQSLIQSEKLASLGALVAGIAHELNTPIGNALASVTTLHQQTQMLERAMQERGALTRRQFESYLASVGEGSTIAHRNLERAAGLIRSFKEVAVDQSSARRRRFDLGQVVEAVLLTLTPTFKTLKHQVQVDIPPNIELDSVPGALEQILTNLIDNAIKHGFSDGRIGHIRIDVSDVEDMALSLTVSDDGVGIARELLPRVFDPFVSSRFGQGGSGLGLHLAYSLARGVLGGELSVQSTGDGGTRFLLHLPRTAPLQSGTETV